MSSVWSMFPLGALCGLLGLPGTIAAQVPPMITDRPDFTESAAVVPPGLVQVEGGYTFARTDGVNAHAFGELLLRVPLLARVEGRLSLNSLLMEDAGEGRARYEGLGVGFKLKVLDGGTPEARWRPDVAVLGGTLLALDGAVDREATVSGRVAAGWTITSVLGLGANLGILSAAQGGDRFTQAVTSFSAGLAAGETTGIYLEYFGLHPETARGPARPFLNGGITQRFGAGLQFDARLGAALSGPSAVFAGAGVSVRW